MSDVCTHPLLLGSREGGKEYDPFFSLWCNCTLTWFSSLQGLYSSVVCPGLVMSNMTYGILPVFLWKLLMPIMWLVSG